MSKRVKYKIGFANPVSHYCEVQIKAPAEGKDSIEFELPVWAPGSYKIRDYSRFVDKVKAEDSAGNNLKCEKINKSAWKVETNGINEAVLSYRVYCNELTVRTSHVTSDHGYINGASVFMYVKGMLDAECELEINPYKDWKKISTGLRKTGENRYSAENYDVFIDSPIEIGNQDILEFEVNGKKHFISIYGKGNYDKDKFAEDFKKIVEAESKMMDGLPYDDFTFLITFADGAGGGLEHLNSFSAMYPPWGFDDENTYKKFLGLISHELFHVWNVKRVRPVELGPFDYSKEVYTKMHWVTEGWTSFFDNLLLRRAGLLDDKEYLGFVADELNEIMRFKGRLYQSLEESSFDNWIKFYNRHENSRNDQISYYKKGALVAMMLDIEIIESSKFEKSLDDAIRMLFEDFKKDPSKGYTSERVKEVCESAAGKNLDEFWEKYISGTGELPIGEYLSKAGVELKDKNKENEVKLGIVINKSGDNILLTEVNDGGSAYSAGLSAGDEIIAINGIRATNKNFKGLMSTIKPGDEVAVSYSRAETMREMKMKIIEQVPNYELVKKEDPTEDEKKIWDKWITG